MKRTVESRTILAVLLSAGIGSYLLFPILSLSDTVLSGRPFEWKSFIWMASELWILYAVFFGLSLISLIVIGGPSYLILRRKGITDPVRLLLAAALAGAISMPLIQGAIDAFWTARPGVFSLENLIMGALCGILYGSIAWLIRRPDKDALPK